MYTMNLHFDQVAKLEIWDIEYTLHGRNKDGVTFKVSFDTEQDRQRAINLLIRS